MSLQKIATIVSSITALFLLTTKFIVGIFSGSIAILSSAIDSFLDMFVSLFNYFVLYNSEKSPDKKFNYGRGKIEALASFIEGLIISVSGLYILYESILKIINKDQISYLGIGIMVMLFSVFITFFLVLFLNYVVKKTNNLVIKADLLHYKTDLYSNSGILIGLAFIYYTGIFYVDSIIGILVGVYIIYSAFELIKKGYLFLLDVSLDVNEIEEIKKIINSHSIVKSFHQLKTRQSGKTKFVDVHLVFSTDIKLVDAHKIADIIEYQIPDIDKSVDWIIMVHLDPYNDCK